jgi:CheY-like chemotaxis protein
MDAVTLKHATKPFFTTKASGAETGLGLPMVCGLVEQSGRVMNITSSPGEGTKVTLWFPVAQGTALPRRGAEAATTETIRERMATARALLGDDEDLLRHVLAEQLEDAGYSIVVAGSGSEALNLLGSRRSGRCPRDGPLYAGMDGLALIDAAREAHPRLPAALLTLLTGVTPPAEHSSGALRATGIKQQPARPSLGQPDPTPH